MFCPNCRDEFREGFERCGRCDVDLVHELPEAPPQKPVQAAPTTVRVAEYCGFLSLDEARSARSSLSEAGIISDILIREVRDPQVGEGLIEEFWLRADRSKLKQVPAVLGDLDDDDGDDDDEQGFHCSECGTLVPDDADLCPGCGARFES